MHPMMGNLEHGMPALMNEVVWPPRSTREINNFKGSIGNTRHVRNT
jgi:hypothetical protein